MEGIEIDWMAENRKREILDLESQVDQMACAENRKIEMPVLEAHAGLIERNKGENVHCRWNLLT